MARARNLRQSAYEAVAADVRYHAGLDIGDMFVAAAKAAGAATAKQLIALGEAFDKGLTDDAKTQAINERLGRGAQRAVVASYLGYRRTAGPSGYRSDDEGPNKRYAGGALRAVLQDDSFFQAGPRTLALINVQKLNSRAKQWARLNFGAGALGRASPGNRAFPLAISDVVIADLGLTAGPRPSFLMPAGYFYGANTAKGGAASGGARERTQRPTARSAGRHAFYLAGTGPNPTASTTKMMMTRGIRAEHFLDNGIAHVAERLGPAYEEYLKDVVKNSSAIDVSTKVRMKHQAKTHKVPRISR